ncbi:PhoU family transcriptional regulator [Carbonactinospora thermoautotrophica]|uniref:Phosphate-specific transport system accessory protein PhoU n=1 Tax=Carbonactinospora thermoautotrophica TaxID=1469144 RepID=A0A132MKV1_9ACTN|nr:phosphate signaling complex protein PhoU [Carbonactinospora thermoautotrophica]KWW98031.1 PhoU family transcriptional regulator [Carbonactinospora thermoautotrophica]KWX03025.1 Phosphate-specific transport system accessory protein PhoU [Carbonactinospora thermoautotrophica]KWX09995.1 PhoU family transcriptional regulator [Carbonactinospora thermoautotrophica]
MREAFREELTALTERLVEMTRFVGTAMDKATQALLQADLPLAESVISADDAVNRLQHEFDQRAIGLIARQQPVATDLRTLVTGLRMAADLERMGDLAVHLAKVARLKYPSRVVPEELRDTIGAMSRVAQDLAAKAGQVIQERDVELAIQMERDDDEMDRLHRTLFQLMLAKDWSHGIETAVDVTLCGRYYERFADHAVSVARRVVYLVTGEYDATAAGAV